MRQKTGSKLIKVDLFKGTTETVFLDELELGHGRRKLPKRGNGKKGRRKIAEGGSENGKRKVRKRNRASNS